MDDDFMFDDENDDFEFDDDLSIDQDEGYNLSQTTNEYSSNTSYNRKNSYEIDYKVISESDIKDMQNKQIDTVSSVSGVSRADAYILLRSYRWNVEKLIELLFDKPDKAYETAGILGSIGKPIPSVPTSLEEVNCSICCEDVLLKFTLTLSCGETFCINCHERYLEQKINEEGKVRKILCPGTCRTFFPDHLVKEIVSDRTEKKFESLLLKAYVTDIKKIYWCPAPDCQYAILYEEPISTLKFKASTVKCKCGSLFCLGCPNGDHMPCLCSVVKCWIKKCADDSETSNWIKANTKECTNCHSTIEKNGGCNHMVCQKCAYEFCWVCMGEWKDHGTSWYNCSRFMGTEDGNTEQSKSRLNLERYLHYFNRYANHQLSSKLDLELYKRIEDKMVQTQINSSMSWIEVQFLKDAVDTLTKSRMVLRWTYALCFYLQQNNMTLILEDNQQDLELATEALSALLEEPIDRDSISKLKQKVLDKTNYINKRYHILVQDIYQGYAENRWTFLLPTEQL